ncbi:SRPBCC domain-containing protein [Martelella soudanensis]|uniref:SRPBCC domain-containing protein n=1 Tax=unclassified Martelella TaxID=2629616 RepID=UPI0015DDFA9C|nr:MULTISPECIES: SRPBCC domain-containing protein [unclassified Martelella]
MSAELDPAKIFRFERLLKAPRALVFEALSDPAHLDRWWGPDGFVNETHAMDFSVGGLWRYTMHGPDGKDWPNWIRYHEITPGRISYEHGGEIGEPAHFRGIIDLDETEDGTLMTMTLVFETSEARDATLKHGAEDGGRQTLAKFDAYLQRIKP